jgi:hypothetical protein
MRWSDSLAPSPASTADPFSISRCGAHSDDKLRCRMLWSDSLAPSPVSTAVRSSSWQLRYVGRAAMTNSGVEYAGAIPWRQVPGGTVEVGAFRERIYRVPNRDDKIRNSVKR